MGSGPAFWAVGIPQAERGPPARTLARAGHSCHSGQDAYNRIALPVGPDGPEFCTFTPRPRLLPHTGYG